MTLTIHAGAGGAEARDWMAMLGRMYTEWLKKNGIPFKAHAEYSPQEIAIEYGDTDQLAGERGVHRLLRISPFDSGSRRHMSFAAVNFVGMPEVEFGSQVRSYILHPYTLVKDHRTDVEVEDAASVLGGNIEPFLNAAPPLGVA